ncbi:MAG: hypothetical protein AB4040_10260 [Synechococcus sp.]
MTNFGHSLTEKSGNQKSGTNHSDEDSGGGVGEPHLQTTRSRQPTSNDDSSDRHR